MTKQQNMEQKQGGAKKPGGATQVSETGTHRELSEDFLKRIPDSLFRINDRTFLVKRSDDKALDALDLQEGVNQVEIGSEIYDFVLMPSARPEDMGQAAMVLASKALMTASDAMVNPRVVTMQNAGKEDLKQASSAWAECRERHDLYAFAKMSDRIDPIVFLKRPEGDVVDKASRVVTKERGFCGYETLKDAIDEAWEKATVPDQFQTFDSLAGTGGEKYRDSSVRIASQILSRHDKVLESPGIPWADLIWNYWMEEAGLVQSMNVLALRFQNRAVPGRADFLRNFELDALRPLSHFIWEYIEAEPHRLSVVRRAYEYEHEYGLRLLGKAVEKMDPYERRHGFIGGFNTLVNLAHKLFRDEDDLQRKADAFPLLNQLQELQSLVQEGAHNQYPELVKKARTEMLMQQYIFTLSPVQEFIRSRPMVVYEEPWMGPLDAMRQAMGWDPVSVSVYHKLAEKSETLLTTIRNYDWVHENVTDAARSWAQSFRNEIQSYAHSYRTVTGVDLTDPVLDPEHATQPSQLIRARMDCLRR